MKFVNIIPDKRKHKYILAKTRWQVRKVVRYMHRVIAKLQFKLAVAGGYIGKASKSFEFLGYLVESQIMAELARKATDNFTKNVVKFYKQSTYLECTGLILENEV